MPRTTVCLLLLAMSSMASVGVLGGFDNYETYLVKSTEVERLAEGLVITRRFMPSTLTAPERCQRYALVLYNYYKEHMMDQFRLANIGLATNERVWQSFKTITMDTLRDLYMDAIKQVQVDSDLDPSFVELVDCLKVKFNNYDAKARSFLNNKQLQRVVDQYKSIASQKIDFLLDDSFKHPSITLKELEEPVRRTVVNWFRGDESRAYSRFLPSFQAPSTTTATTTTTTTTTTTPTPPIPTPNYNPAMLPTSTYAPYNPPPPPRLSPMLMEQTVLPHSFTMPEPQAPIRPLMVPPYIPEPLKPQPPPPMPPMVPQMEQPIQPPMQQLEPQLGAENLMHQMSEQQIQLLLKVIGLVHELYNTLPLDSKLNDRCQAYSELLTADPQTLTSQLVSDISRQVNDRLAQKGPNEKKFVPDSNTRENFLFTISAFPKQDIGDETWMDLVDCASQWEFVDSQVRDFMNNPQHYYEEMSLPPSQQL